MHRVRYFKINGRMVWDRTSKLDILTGNEQQNEASDGRKENFSRKLLRINQRRLSQDESTTVDISYSLQCVE
jgi:hypothetical protein